MKTGLIHWRCILICHAQRRTARSAVMQLVYNINYLRIYHKHVGSTYCRFNDRTIRAQLKRDEDSGTRRYILNIVCDGLRMMRCTLYYIHIYSGVSITHVK